MRTETKHGYADPVLQRRDFLCRHSCKAGEGTLMTWYNWLIAIVPFSFVFYMAFHTRKYIRGIPDFLAGGRLCGRYLLSVGQMEAGLSVMFLIAYIEVHYRTGFSTGFWANFSAPIALIVSLTGFVTYRLRETKALSMGQFLEMRYNRSFRLFCAFLRTTVELLSNMILPAISARFFIYLLGIPHYIDIFGFKVQSLALVIGIVLILAATILLAGGSLALLITDTIQGLLTYPIIFIFTMYIILSFSWWDEIVPVMSDRVAGESFINPYDIKSLRDFNLFAAIVTIFVGPGGFALLHPRNHQPYMFFEPFIVAARSIAHIHFGAPDGQPTDLFFLICCPDDRIHLHVLARLCMMAHHTDLLPALREAPTPAGFLDALLASEAQVLQQANA